ncbi:MAG: hypothetical protein OEL87_01420 [Nanoarchaeota archaeon]|nr:hypothetical protein [Nanoarchaeota archaeon]
MVTKEELYISISPDFYRVNKSNILMNQADLLETLKRFHHLTVLARQKHDLKKRLQKLLASTISDIDSIQNKMPEPKLPRIIQKSREPSVKIKESFSGRDDIEDELRLIHEKLRELNS